MKRVLVYMLAGMALVGTSCSDFLDTIPHDALSPSTTWQTEKDAEKFLIGCYDGWADETGILYWDCASDFGFNFHVHENYRNIGNGSMTASNAVADYYKFGMIRRCNDFLTNIQNIEERQYDWSGENDPGLYLFQYELAVWRCTYYRFL